MAYEMRISDWSSDVCASDLGFGEDEDGLGVILKGVGLVQRCRRGTVLDRKADCAIVIAPRNNAARTPGDFGHNVRPEMLDDLVERAGNGRKRREPFDHSVAATHGLAIDDRVAVLVVDRPGR